MLKNKEIIITTTLFYNYVKTSILIINNEYKYIYILININFY
jgi:hypothetical protein